MEEKTKQIKNLKNPDFLEIESRNFIENVLKTFPFVEWDRFVDMSNHVGVYGWIKRPSDNYRDFLVLQIYYKNKKVSWITSSVEFHNQISKIINGEVTKANCLRIEWFFDIPNMIKI